MDKSKMTEHIKVNLPLTEQDYLSGNGEGVWMLVDRETKMEADTWGSSIMTAFIIRG